MGEVFSLATNGGGGSEGEATWETGGPGEVGEKCVRQSEIVSVNKLESSVAVGRRKGYLAEII